MVKQAAYMPKIVICSRSQYNLNRRATHIKIADVETIDDIEVVEREKIPSKADCCQVVVRKTRVSCWCMCCTIILQKVRSETTRLVTQWRSSAYWHRRSLAQRIQILRLGSIWRPGVGSIGTHPEVGEPLNSISILNFEFILVVLKWGKLFPSLLDWKNVRTNTLLQLILECHVEAHKAAHWRESGDPWESLSRQEVF